MAVTWVGRDIYCAAADVASLTTNVPANTKAYVDNDDVYRFNGTSWVLFAANDKTETLTGKTISGSSNTLTSIPVNSLSNFAVSSPTTNQVLQYNGTNWVNATSAGSGGALSNTYNYKIYLDGANTRLVSLHNTSVDTSNSDATLFSMLPSHYPIDQRLR